MKSVERALAVIEALGRARALQEIAELSGLPKPTAHRILQVLVERGFARDEGDGVYAGGPRILTVAGEVLSGLDPAGRARPLLRDLRERADATVHFGLLTGDEAIYIDKVESRRPYQMASRVGNRLALHCTAIGKAILAHLSEEELTAVLGLSELTARTPNTITALDALHSELDRIRAAGYAVDDEENERGIRCVGAAVFDHRRRAVGAISVSSLVYELSRDDAEALGPIVAAAANDVSALFGAPLLDEVAAE